MRFKITATTVDRGSKVIDDYPCIEEFGYQISQHEELLSKTGLFRYTFEEFVEINSIEDLDRLCKLVDNQLIFCTCDDDEGPTIEIYDGWRE